MEQGGGHWVKEPGGGAGNWGEGEGEGEAVRAMARACGHYEDAATRSQFDTWKSVARGTAYEAVAEK